MRLVSPCSSATLVSPRALLSALLLLPLVGARGRRRNFSAEELEDFPTRLPTKKEASDSGATAEAASSMPWFATHRTLCNGRLCRPGEGNLDGYKMWSQPYIHREAWVQSRLRRWPHPPDPERHYSDLVRHARRVQRDNLVVMAAADFDWREIILNWAAHLARIGMPNHLVLSMDVELHAHLQRRGVASVDNSAQLEAWNATCLQRHIQRVRMERHVAAAALVASGLDVLLTDATVVFLRDPRPVFAAPPLADVDVLVQREGGPAAAVRKVGVGCQPGFMLVRAKRAEAMARLFADIVRRGLVEFYNRWNNVADALGWSFIVADTAVELRCEPSARCGTSPLTNESTLTTLSRCALPPSFSLHSASAVLVLLSCDSDRRPELRPGPRYDGVRVGFLPHDRFPRIGSWDVHRSAAFIWHLVHDGTLGAWYEAPWARGVAPFRGHRQRLDRYDAIDFDAHRKVMKEVGLWLVAEQDQER